MLTVYACITQLHDLRLVALAAVICVIGMATATSLAGRAGAVDGRRDLWLAGAAVVFGCGVWATHFVAELAYLPGLPVGYDPALTAASGVVAVGLSQLAFALALRSGYWITGGMVLGTGAAAMHYLGMAAIQVAAERRWDAAFVAASLILAVAFAAAGMRLLRGSASWRRRVGAAAAFVAAVCSLHFVAVAAVVLVPDPLLPEPDALLSPRLLAIAVAAVTAIIISAGLIVLLVDSRLADQALKEAERLRESEAQLRLAMGQADAANRAKSQFLANMSHEMRTPLNGVIGTIELLLDTKPTEQQRRYFESMRTLSQGLLGLIDNLLDLSRIEAGTIMLRREVFSLMRAIDEVVQPAMVEAHAKGLELCVFVDRLVPDAVVGDAARLRQILAHLLSNAVKFTSAGEVVLRVTCMDPAEFRVQLRFEVQDTGPGIDPRLREHIFDSFTQGDGSNTRSFGGSGIGLAIVRELVALHGGYVGVDQPEGGGACFWFAVPLSRDMATQSAPPGPEYEGRVLIVDSRATSSAILRRYCEEAGLQTEHVDDAPAAVAALRRGAEAGQAFDAVVADAGPRADDEAALLASLRGEAAGRHMPVVLASLHGDVQEVSGNVRRLAKPLGRAALTQALAAVRLAPPLDAVEPPKPPPAPVGTYAAAVLLVEDNAVNLEVAREVLTRLGCSVGVAEDGQQALAACAASHFDIVFMDCQMPVMDGFAATRELRRKEKSAPGGRHQIIVALSANTSEADRAMCKEAGMDDFLAKPFTRRTMAAILDRFLKQPAEAAGAPSEPEGPAIDDAVVGALRAGRPDFWRRLVALFEDERQKATAAIADALTAGDAGRTKAAAHRMKSAAGNVGAARLAEIYRRIEQAAGSGQLAACQELSEAARTESERVSQAMAGADAASPPVGQVA